MRASKRALAGATAIGSATVLADLALSRWAGHAVQDEARGAVALVAVALYLPLVRGDFASVGLTTAPAQGWTYWAKATLAIGLLVGALIAVVLGAWKAFGGAIPVYTTAPQDFGRRFLSACIAAPVLEETTYRLVVCVPAAVLLKPWGAIAASGLLFGALHVACGVPSPENLVGGFFLAWAYLKSGTILVPVLLHSLGNLCVLTGQVVAWYWVG